MCELTLVSVYIICGHLKFDLHVSSLFEIRVDANGVTVELKINGEGVVTVLKDTVLHTREELVL